MPGHILLSKSMILDRWWFQHLRGIFDCPIWGAPGIWWMRNRECWISYIDFWMPEWNLERPQKVGTFQDRRYVFCDLCWYSIPWQKLNYFDTIHIKTGWFARILSFLIFSTWHPCHVISILINISLFHFLYLVFFSVTPDRSFYPHN